MGGVTGAADADAALVDILGLDVRGAERRTSSRSDPRPDLDLPSLEAAGGMPLPMPLPRPTAAGPPPPGHPRHAEERAAQHAAQQAAAARAAEAERARAALEGAAALGEMGFSAEDRELGARLFGADAHSAVGLL